MSRFLQITRYEFRMFTRRASFWIAYILLGLFYAITILTPSENPAENILSLERAWSEAGHLVFMFNIFMPLLAGILTADRMQRDFRGGIRELQRSTPLAYSTYILAKYLGALIATLLPVFIILMGDGIFLVLRGTVPLEFLGFLLAAFLVVALPAHAFVVAFSLVCPLVMPLRVYQVLFTGYWFWGNMLSPNAFPTISQTLLNAVGQFPLQAYFGVLTDSSKTAADIYTPLEAVLNLLVLVACITAALLATRYYLQRQARHA